MSSSRTSITKKACDGCKIRKIRCGGGQPCKSCSNARIKCTYIRVHQPRGPQKLRPMTKYLIEQAQRGVVDGEDAPLSPQPCDPVSYPVIESVQSSLQSTRIHPKILSSPLYTYHVRMYPVWPIVDVQDVMASLQKDTGGEDNETYALATAVAAATIAQLRLNQNTLPDKSVTAETLADECLKARRLCDYRSKVNLNNVRTAFFLHVYYENQRPGGSESLLYLRESISLAQMMSLNREAAYTNLPPAEQQIRRRVLWLLFVTERGVCILHKFPVVLRTDIATPELDTDDEPQVLPAFLKLLNLFRSFEQSRMFDLIEDDYSRMPSWSHEMHGLDRSILDTLQQDLRDGSAVLDHISDVQKADLCVTRHWMRMILWKVSSRTRATTSSSSHSFTSPAFPVLVAKDLLSIVTQLPRTAIEAHGLGMELKLYEIANSLADAVTDLAIRPQNPVLGGESRPSSILARLYSILSTFRGGGNKKLAEVLYKKMADAQCIPSLTLTSTPKSTHRKERPAITGLEPEKPTVVPPDPVLTLEHSLNTFSSSDYFAAGDSWPTEELEAFSQPAIGQGTFSHQGIGYEPQQVGEMVPSSFVIDLQSQPDYSASLCDPDFDAPPSAFPVFPADSPLNWSFLSSLPSSSVEMLVSDFISDVPQDQLETYDYTSEGFLV